LQLVLYRKPDDVEDEELTRAADTLVAEYTHFEHALRGPFFGGDAPDAADFALYPFLAFVDRFEMRKPDLGMSDRIGEPLQTWMARMRALPLVERTRPPHWRT
jgi:glutathione S-transferase